MNQPTEAEVQKLRDTIIALQHQLDELRRYDIRELRRRREEAKANLEIAQREAETAQKVADDARGALQAIEVALGY